MSVGQDHSKKVLLGFRYRIPLARGEKTAEPWFCWDWVINCWLRILELFAGSNTPKCYRNAPWGTSTSSTLRFQALIYGLYPVHPSTLYTSCQTKWQWQNPNFLTKKNKQTHRIRVDHTISTRSPVGFQIPRGPSRESRNPPKKQHFPPALLPAPGHPRWIEHGFTVNGPKSGGTLNIPKRCPFGRFFTSIHQMA